MSMKGFKILRVFMLIALALFTAYAVYYGICDVVEGKTGDAALQFVCAGIDIACWFYWLIVLRVK